MAMQGFEVNSLDPAYQLELLKGVEAEVDSVFKEVFTPEQVETMSGKVPYIPSKFTLLSDDDSVHTKIGVADEPDVLEMGTNSVEFDFDGKYSKEAKIHKTVVETLSRLRGAEDLVQYLGSIAMGFVNTAIDTDGATILKSTTLNATVSAADAWSDASNADPFTDFDGLVDEVGSINPLIWLGLNKARELSALPAFRDAAKNFDATGGRVSLQMVSDILMDRYNAERVIIDASVWQNDNNVAQTINKSHIFDDVVWVGDPDHMLVVERSDLREVDSEYKSKSGNYHTWITEYLDIARAETERGAVLTGS